MLITHWNEASWALSVQTHTHTHTHTHRDSTSFLFVIWTAGLLTVHVMNETRPSPFFTAIPLLGKLHNFKHNIVQVA